MKGRHLVMMSLGSALGACLFVGSGAGSAAAGPSILVSYIVAGVLIILIMRMLGEMVADSPTSGAFSVYAGRAVSPAAGFAVGRLWWVQLILVIAAEATAAAQILVAAWPVAPQWLLALIFMSVFTAINLIGVGRFGEFEFWFSLLKVGAVVAFLVIGGLFVLGLLVLGMTVPGVRQQILLTGGAVRGPVVRRGRAGQAPRRDPVPLARGVRGVRDRRRAALIGSTGRPATYR